MLETVSMATAVVHGLVEPKRPGKSILTAVKMGGFTSSVHGSFWSKGKPGKIPALLTARLVATLLYPWNDGRYSRESYLFLFWSIMPLTFWGCVGLDMFRKSTSVSEVSGIFWPVNWKSRLRAALASTRTKPHQVSKVISLWSIKECSSREVGKTDPQPWDKGWL